MSVRLGAGIRQLGTSLRMTECTVAGNGGPDHFGGGIFTETSTALEMTRCTVRDNHSTPGPANNGFGGGVFAQGTTTLTDCLIEANSAGDSGGGAFVNVGATTLSGTTQVQGNRADTFPFSGGGGIAVNSAGTLIVSDTCRVTQNTAATGGGGGILNRDGTATITLQGQDPSPIVVNNCHENCAGGVPKCAATPVSC